MHNFSVQVSALVGRKLMAAMQLDAKNKHQHQKILKNPESQDPKILIAVVVLQNFHRSIPVSHQREEYASAHYSFLQIHDHSHSQQKHTQIIFVATVP